MVIVFSILAGEEFPTTFTTGWIQRKGLHALASLWFRGLFIGRMRNGLRAQLRQARSRAPEPSTAAADSQSVRTAETVACSSRGYYANAGAAQRERDQVFTARPKMPRRL